MCLNKTRTPQWCAHIPSGTAGSWPVSASWRPPCHPGRPWRVCARRPAWKRPRCSGSQHWLVYLFGKTPESGYRPARDRTQGWATGFPAGCSFTCASVFRSPPFPPSRTRVLPHIWPKTPALLPPPCPSAIPACSNLKPALPPSPLYRRNAPEWVNSVS